MMGWEAIQMVVEGSTNEVCLAGACDVENGECGAPTTDDSSDGAYSLLGMEALMKVDNVRLKCGVTWTRCKVV